MPCSITCSTKILTLAVAPFLFILVGVIFEFAMMPDVYILWSPQEEEVHYSYWGHKFTHSATHSSKRFKPLSDIMLLSQGCCWIEKNTSKEFSCVMVFRMKSSSFLKFQFVFGFNECLWAVFSLLNFEHFWFYIWVVVVWLLILWHKWLQVTSYPNSMNKKFECEDHQKYSRMLRKICKREL